VNFKPLFEPKTVAVIGVSLSNHRHPANVIYNKALHRYPATVYPVNPRGGVLQGNPVFADIGEIPDRVDLAVVAVRAELVPDVLAACIRAGVGGATVISGGFAEVGRNDLQQQLADMAREADFPFIGPNCLGIYAPNVVDTFFLPAERLVLPEAGNVAFVSQSGGVLVDQMVTFAGEGVGVSLAVSIGNKALLREIDLLDYLADDPRTRVIAFYIEGFARGEGRTFAQAARRCSKPVVVLKSGKSPGGRRAASSHTASMAGDYTVFSSVLAQHGIVEVINDYRLVSYCEALSCYPEAIHGRVGILTGSGGHGVLSVDICSAVGLEVPELSASEQDRIRRRLHPNIQGIASLKNPVDVTGSADDDDFFEAALGLCQSEQIDCVIILLLPYSPGISSDLGARISHLYRHEGKPLVAYVPSSERYRMLIEGFELNGIPVAASIERAVYMADAMRRCQPC